MMVSYTSVIASFYPTSKRWLDLQYLALSTRTWRVQSVIQKPIRSRRVRLCRKKITDFGTEGCFARYWTSFKRALRRAPRPFFPRFYFRRVITQIPRSIMLDHYNDRINAYWWQRSRVDRRRTNTAWPRSVTYTLMEYLCRHNNNPNVWKRYYDVSVRLTHFDSNVVENGSAIKVLLSSSSSLSWDLLLKIVCGAPFCDICC